MRRSHKEILLADQPIDLLREVESTRPFHPTQTLLHLEVFTDVFFAESWAMQRILRKIHLDYGSQIKVRFHMLGVVPSWDEVDTEYFRTPEDVKSNWEEVAKGMDVPLNTSIWDKDPLHTSYRSGIAFKAAEFQNKELANAFLHELHLMLYCEGENIAWWKQLSEAGRRVGLDTDQLLNDYNNGRALGAFLIDVKEAKNANITRPTIRITNLAMSSIDVSSIAEVSALESLLHKFEPQLQSRSKLFDPSLLLARFHDLYPKELAMILGADISEATAHLESLTANGHLQRKETEFGYYYHAS